MVAPCTQDINCIHKTFRRRPARLLIFFWLSIYVLYPVRGHSFLQKKPFRGTFRKSCYGNFSKISMGKIYQAVGQRRIQKPIKYLRWNLLNIGRWCRSGVFIDNLEHISHFFVVLLCAVYKFSIYLLIYLVKFLFEWNSYYDPINFPVPKI